MNRFGWSWSVAVAAIDKNAEDGLFSRSQIGDIPDPAGPPEAKEPFAVVLLGLGLFFGWSGLFYLFGALYLVWETHTAYSKADIGLCFTVSLLTAALVAPVSGRIIDAGRGRLLLATGATIGGIGLAVVAISTTYNAFIFGWLLVGLGQGTCLYEPTFTFLARVLRQRARKTIVLVGLLGGLSTAFVYPVASWAAVAYEWRIAVWLFVVLNVGVMAPLMYVGATILEPASCHLDRSTRQRVASDALAQARRRPAYWVLLVAFSLMAFCEGLVLAHGVPALVELGEDETKAILSMALIGVFQFLARIALLWLGSRTASVWLAFASILFMSLGTFAIIASQYMENSGLFFAALFGLGYGVSVVIKPVVISECLGYVSIGAILGAMALPYYFILAIAPYAGSLLWEEGGYMLAITVAGSVSALSAIGLSCLAVVKTNSRAGVALD